MFSHINAHTATSNRVYSLVCLWQSCGRLCFRWLEVVRIWLEVSSDLWNAFTGVLA